MPTRSPGMAAIHSQLKAARTAPYGGALGPVRGEARLTDAERPLVFTGCYESVTGLFFPNRGRARPVLSRDSGADAGQFRDNLL